MWLKLVLITAFFVFMALLSRVMDMMAINGTDLLSTHIFVNSIGLSVRQLKYLLDARGISYDGVLERPELIRLVDDSGPVTERQLLDCDEDQHHKQMAASDMQIREMLGDITAKATIGSSLRRFSSGAHLYEEVEDTKDSAWIVNVMAAEDNGHNRIDSGLWSQVVDKSWPFGIRSAIFDCSLDPELCRRKGWLSSRLVLALPREGLRTKEDVLMMTYAVGPNTRLQHILDWIRKQLATRVAVIETDEDLETNWLRTVNNKDNDSNSSTSINIYNDIKMVFISSLAAPPLILSALAIKFSGRIRFGFFRANTKRRRSLVARLDKRIPSYIVVLPDRHYHYGYKAGETLKYSSMEALLRTLRPETNDFFLLSLILTNLSLGLHLFWMKCSRLWKHLIYWFMTAIKYNCILFLIWLSALTLYNVPLMAALCTYGHQLCQWLSLTSMATIIRYDFQYNYKPTFLLFAFTTFGLLVAIFRRTLISSGIDDNDDHLLFRDWTPWESRLLSYILFRPITMNSFHRPIATNASIDMNLEEGMELLIERLAVPTLWLQPELISSDYIKDLPVWQHQSAASDATTSSEVSDSDDASSVSSGDILNAKSAANLRKTHSQSLSTTVSKSTLDLTGQLCRQHNTSHKTSAHSSPGKKCQCLSASNTTATDTGAANTSNLEAKSMVSNSRSVTRHRATTTATDQSIPAKPKEKVVLINNNNNNCNQNQVPDGMIKCNECAICLETYRTGMSICGLPCGHNYHENCIMLWLYRDNHCCPTCRWPTYKQKAKHI